MRRTKKTLPFNLALASLAALACSFGPAIAAPADIANAPMVTTASSVRSNLMLILDDSGSMSRDYMPEEVLNSGLCFGYSAVNRIFYDPAVTYTVPLQSTGQPFTAPGWPSAYEDGYAASPVTVSLASAPQWSRAGPSTSDGSRSPPATTNTFYYVQASASSSVTEYECPGVSRVRLSPVTDLSTLTAAQRQNYVIWYTYYRTRLLAMRGAIGTVMASIDATRFRIGMSAISDIGTDDSSNKFLNIRDFNATTPLDQKHAFFSRLYSISPGGYTPLRPALEKAGKYFANRRLDGSPLPAGRDPVQYSCQRNYAILTTDGYWNTRDESNYRSSYGPTQLNGSTGIGNTDSSASNTPRPMLDDGKDQGANWVTGGDGVSNALADIAMYFYATDLRDATLGNCTGALPGESVCVNNLPPVGSDNASHQHMTTFTMGLGVSGRLVYRPDYDTATTGDFYAIRQGTKPWPNPDPTSISDTVVERIDDLWHAAVNGRGRYYAANNPADVASGMKNALQSIESVSGAGAAAATSTLQPVTGDNFLYLGTYTTVLWEGNIKALTIDTTTGAVSTTPAWEAKNTLAAQVAPSSDSRSIYFFNSSAPNQLSSFTFANLSAAGFGNLFQNVCSMSQPLSQCPSIASMGTTELASANSGANLVNYLRGQKGYEDIVANPVDSRLFRGRNTPLGDLVNAAPVYAKKPPFRYTDAGYNTFASSNANRTGVVYAAANDGMLHAFNAQTGTELWAYVPTAALPNMYRLADKNYSANHRFFVDGSPTMSDVYDGSRWRTIVVGGLGAGGRAYYALDVTDPANPRALWEFTNSDLGLAFGNPIIAKNKAGTWIVAFSSGYNNVNPGSGNGYLFVLNAVTGALIEKIPTLINGTTAAGTPETPSNLGKISPWVDADTNNTALRFYGGDMLGNIWRFDFDDVIDPSGKEAVLLARALTPSGESQPITSRPQLTEVANGGPKLVSVGTGRMLGASDVSDVATQSLYVFQDTLGSGIGILRENSGMVQQTLANVTVSGSNTRRIDSLVPVDWKTKLGWYVDFTLTPGERVNTDMIQVGNLLSLATNIPSPSVCTPGGSSWLYFFDIRDSNVYAAVYGDVMTAGLNVVKLQSGLRIIRWNIRGEPDVHSPGPGVGAPPGTLRRVSWRELVY